MIVSGTHELRAGIHFLSRVAASERVLENSISELKSVYPRLDALVTLAKTIYTDDDPPSREMLYQTLLEAFRSVLVDVSVIADSTVKLAKTSGANDDTLRGAEILTRCVQELTQDFAQTSFEHL